VTGVSPKAGQKAGQTWEHIDFVCKFHKVEFQKPVKVVRVLKTLAFLPER